MGLSAAPDKAETRMVTWVGCVRDAGKAHTVFTRCSLGIDEPSEPLTIINCVTEGPTASTSWWRSWKGLGVVAWPLVVTVLSWLLIGRPAAERNEQQANALAQRTEARVSIATFVAQRPDNTEAQQRAIDLYRDGRRLVDAGKYEQARDRFTEAFSILEEACPDCPGVKIEP